MVSMLALAETVDAWHRLHRWAHFGKYYSPPTRKEIFHCQYSRDANVGVDYDEGEPVRPYQYRIAADPMLKAAIFSVPRIYYRMKYQ